MIVRVHASTNNSFIISGIKPKKSVTPEEIQQDAEAMVHVLAGSLPGNTFNEIARLMNHYINTPQPLYEDIIALQCEHSAKELEIK